MQFNFKTLTVECPFVPNKEQTDALLALEDFYYNPRKYNNQITLAGVAGGGKTSVIGIYNTFLNKKRCYPIYSAPTHRANAVTKLRSPFVTVMTLHSLFGLSPKIDLEGGNYSLETLRFTKGSKAKAEKDDFIIIDESSMIPDTLEDYLNYYKNLYNLKIVYVGDPKQLKSVGSKTISKVFTTGTVLLLHRVERTGDNAILEESTNLRSGLDFTYQSKVNDLGHGVEYIDSKEKVLEIIEQEFSSQNFKNNPLYFRILSATNKEVFSINRLARKLLFETNEQLVIGDIMMGYNNFNVDYDTKEPLIQNSGDYIVTNVIEGTKQVKLKDKHVIYNGYYVTLKQLLNPKDKAKSIFVVDNNEEDYKLLQFVNLISELNIQGAEFMKQNKKKEAAIKFSAARAYESELAFMRNCFDAEGRLKIKKTLDYGYAHSINKSQGGTYNKVLILADTITEPFGPETIQELKYVAVTRASEFVYLYTKQKIK